MELSFSELSKKEVINMADGRSLGRVCDLTLDFPDGVLTGVFVPGRKNRGIFRIFDKTKIFIPERDIIKIGGDVILVDLKCGDICSPSVKRRQNPPPPPCPPKSNQCPPKCPKPIENPHGRNQNQRSDFQIFGEVDTEDY